MSMPYLYNVPTKKEVLVTVRISEKVRDQFKIACELRGASMSSLLHQFIVRTIREEKDLTPSAFAPGYHQVPKWTPDVGRITEDRERSAREVPAEVEDTTAVRKRNLDIIGELPAEQPTTDNKKVRKPNK